MTEANNEVNQAEEQTSLFFGARLKAARKTLGLSTKDVSYQLRLKENIIERIESDQLPGDLPLAFARGYMRTYGKFLSIKEEDINNAIKTLLPDIEPTVAFYAQTKKASTFLNKQRAMQLATSLVSITLVGLVISWWFGHNPNSEQKPVFAINNKQDFHTQIQLTPQTIKLDTLTAPNAAREIENNTTPATMTTTQADANKPATTILPATTSDKTVNVATPNESKTKNTTVESQAKPVQLASNQAKPIQDSHQHEDDYYDDEYDDDEME